MSYVPRPMDRDAQEGARRFLRWVKGKTAAQIRKAIGPPSWGPCDCPGADEAKRLRAEVADLRRRVRLARVAFGDAYVARSARAPAHERADAECRAFDLLDLRKSLPKRGGKGPR